MRTALGFLVLVAIPLWLAVDLWVALENGWWTSSSTPQVVFGICGAVFAIALALLAFPAGRRGLARRWAPLVAMHVMLVLAWGAGELVVSATYAQSALFHRYTPDHRSVFTPDPAVMPGVAGEAHHTTNGRGMRGTPVPAADAAYQVLCVGGSTTACLFLDDAECWPALLQEEGAGAGSQPLWVGDVGKSGYGSWHHVKLLGYPEVFADIDCVVVLAGINDHERALQGHRLHSTFGHEPAYERSSIYTLAHNVYQAQKQRRQFEREFSDGRAYVLRRQRRAAATLVDEVPDVDEALRDYRANLTLLARTLTERGHRVVFLTQPVLWRAGLSAEAKALLWLGVPDDDTAIAVPRLAASMARFNAVMREVCTATGVECVDLAAAMNGDARWFFDDCHFTEAGAREVARIVGEHFRAVGW